MRRYKQAGQQLIEGFTMQNLIVFAVILLLGLPAPAGADLGGIPGTATWYFHADFDAMRNGKAGRGVYDWLDAEVFEEIRSEIGIDLDKEAGRLTAFSGPGEGPVIMLDGNVSQDTRDKIMALAAADGELQTFKSSGKAYYFFDGEKGSGGSGKINIDIDSLRKEAYVSMAIDNKILVTNTQQQMKKLLADNGVIKSDKRDGGALFVLRADRSLVQAGVKADRMNDGDGWDSNILRNTRQVAVLMADRGEKLGFEAQLMANEPEMANSLASIIRGLISLQAFNEDLDKEIAEVLQSTIVDVAGSTLSLSLSVNPDTVVSALED
ncbi:MAG: hypothetical protein HKN64_03595 [Woeseiaceae bacterium]|nr:hypothetical protein [Woeseiaceae bacterium]